MCITVCTTSGVCPYLRGFLRSARLWIALVVALCGEFPSGIGRRLPAMEARVSAVRQDGAGRAASGGLRGKQGGRISADPRLSPIPRLALSREDAAAALGMSLDSFERHVQPTVRMVRLGRMRLVPVAELARWLDDRATRTLDAA